MRSTTKRRVCAILVILFALAIIFGAAWSVKAAPPDMRPLMNANAGMAVSHFTDVPERTWFSTGVSFAYKTGLMRGVSETRFSPAEPMDRAMIVTVLWRMYGAPPALHVSFDDVPVKCYYAQAAAWAQREGITEGTASCIFSPNMHVTREQLVTFLWRASDSPAESGQYIWKDADEIGAWAAGAVAWAQENGIVEGSAGYFRPKAPCTRAEAATIIARYCYMIGGDAL